MHLDRVAPLIVVDDITATIAFYRDLLDFAIVTAIPNAGSPTWVLMRNGAVEVMFQTRHGIPESQRPPYWTGLSLHFDGTGIRQKYELLKNRVQIVRHLAPTLNGMLEFWMRDCNGHMLIFAERVAKDEE
jgi:catechol 2,3-dioxygenase-like lactoylglutathione lyase family enzyme